MKGQTLIILLLLLTSGFMSAQEYSYVLLGSELVASENPSESGIYVDDYGTCFVATLVLESYDDEMDAVRNMYSEATFEKVLPEVVRKGNLKVEIMPAQSGWIMKKIYGNCLSSNPKDCLVKCHISAPERITSVSVLDETQPVLWETLSPEVIELLKQSAYIIYSEQTCDTDSDTLSQLRNALGLVDVKDFSTALRLLQYENGLPIGPLNLETLNFIGLDQ